MKYSWLTESEQGVSNFEDRDIPLAPTEFTPPQPLIFY